ncbi:hypothetical protein [Micromonospora sp. C95]|uniref:hypothetical protein n=1 Tax=Micromonospora sp. C95 TaxID=2824882 RepID=UPI001B38FBD0|nr:hypothetical protein [Micromonospora sp. C95]MBQ1025627.1 hypothetical protein [Micromonospora sp. C95]
MPRRHAHLEMWLDLPPGEDADHIGADEVIDELNAAADQSVRHPSYARRPGRAAVHNLFATGFAFSGNLISAGGQFDVIGDQVTEWPWQYFDGADPTGAFGRFRDKAYAVRA